MSNLLMKCLLVGVWALSSCTSDEGKDPGPTCAETIGEGWVVTEEDDELLVTNASGKVFRIEFEDVDNDGTSDLATIRTGDTSGTIDLNQNTLTENTLSLDDLQLVASMNFKTCSDPNKADLAGVFGNDPPPPTYSTSDAIELATTMLSDSSSPNWDDYPARYEQTTNNDVVWLQERASFEDKFAEWGKCRAGDIIIEHNFILADEEAGMEIAGHLLDAANRGAMVFLSYDTFGTTIYGKLATDALEMLNHPNIAIAPNNSLVLLATMEHYKTTVVVRKGECPILWTGGQGWSPQYSGTGLAPGEQIWNDGAFRVQGDAAIQQLVQELGQAAEKGLEIVPKTLPPEEAKALLLETFFDYPLETFPGKMGVTVENNLTWSNRPITTEYYGHFDDPETDAIIIAQPYITDNVGSEKLLGAVHRGVDVKLLIPGLSDAMTAQKITSAIARGLIDEAKKFNETHKHPVNVEVRLYNAIDAAGNQVLQDGKAIPTMSHEKFAVFKKRLGRNPEGTQFIIGGSYNLTSLEGRSSEENFNILVRDLPDDSDGHFGQDIQAAFDREFKQATAFDPGSLFDQIVASLLTALGSMH